MGKKFRTRQAAMLCSCVAFIISLNSCQKFTDVGEPMDRITTANAFSTDQSATAAVLGVYSQMMSTSAFITSAGTTLNAGMSADELTFTATTATSLAINNNTITVDNSIISNDMWHRAYVHIYHINACLEGLAASTTVSAAVKDQLTGELLFLRSFVYYYLVNFFGDVPLVTGTDYRLNATAPRTEVSTLYSQMKTDLASARTLMSAQHPSPQRGRPTRHAAAALLSRIYLHEQNWAAAEATASEVISSGAALLVNNPDNIFLANSNEALWQLVPVQPGFNTTEGARFIPTTTTVRPLYALTPTLMAAFEPGDLRRSAWVRVNTVSGQQFFYPFKYKVRMNATVTEHYMMLRLAEQYLIRAEARAQQNKIALAQADLNMLRSRAGLPNTTANTQASLLQAIMRERRIELFAEWGHRWFDLKRTGTADAVLQPLKPGWQPHAVWYPIPQSQIDRNPMLTQNPGY